MSTTDSTNTAHFWPEWSKNANIYEVNIRQYTEEGTFKAFEKHLERLSKMGVDILWLMPIFPISLKKRKGSLGSYYAPSSYVKVNPEYGDENDFKKLVSKAHYHGMKVIIDWVPNHTGWDHEWIDSHPEYYQKDSTGVITTPLDGNGQPKGWDDVAALDYRLPELREAMTEAMIFWLKEMKIDGFRQDMALMVPLDFWITANERLKAINPDIFLVAESETHDHVNKAGFHSIYSWSLHYILNQIAQGKMNATDIDRWYRDERPRLNRGCYMLFTSNHDENSWNGSEIERMGEAYKAFAVLTGLLDGLPLVYSGQEGPEPRRLKFFDKDKISFGNYAHSDFYRVLHELKHSHPALWNAEFGGQVVRILNHNHIFAFERSVGSDKITVVINLSHQTQHIQPDHTLEGTDIFTSQEIHISDKELLSLPPWSYLVLK